LIRHIVNSNVIKRSIVKRNIIVVQDASGYILLQGLRGAHKYGSQVV